MDVLFCHGLESAPHGAKFHALANAGLQVVAPDCRNQDLSRRVTLLTDAIATHRPRVVVGSSFGGLAGLLACIVARSRDLRVEGLVLCAPALALQDPEGFSLERTCPAPTIIIHGPTDSICPFEASERFAEEHGAKLMAVDDDHRLGASLEVIVGETKRLLG